MVEKESSEDRIFRALADPTRRRMVERLSAGECSVGQLAEPLSMTLAGASKHVGILERAGLVLRERRGRQQVCSLQTAGLIAARDWVERHAAAWTARFDALEIALKEEDDDDD